MGWLGRQLPCAALSSNAGARPTTVPTGRCQGCAAQTGPRSLGFPASYRKSRSPSAWPRTHRLCCFLCFCQRSPGLSSTKSLTFATGLMPCPLGGEEGAPSSCTTAVTGTSFRTAEAAPFSGSHSVIPVKHWSTSHKTALALKGRSLGGVSEVASLAPAVPPMLALDEVFRPRGSWEDLFRARFHKGFRAPGGPSTEPRRPSSNSTLIGFTPSGAPFTRVRGVHPCPLHLRVWSRGPNRLMSSSDLGRAPRGVCLPLFGPVPCPPAPGQLLAPPPSHESCHLSCLHVPDKWELWPIVASPVQGPCPVGDDTRAPVVLQDGCGEHLSGEPSGQSCPN